jgi:hypothetical protein
VGPWVLESDLNALAPLGFYPTLNDDHMTSVSSLTNMGVNSKRCKYQTKSFVFVELSLEPQEDEI